MALYRHYGASEHVWKQNNLFHLQYSPAKNVSGSTAGEKILGPAYKCCVRIARLKRDNSVGSETHEPKYLLMLAVSLSGNKAAACEVGLVLW